MRVLLSDDDPVHRVRTANALREAGHRVVEVESEEEIMTQLASGFLDGRRHGGFDFLICGSGAVETLRHAHLTTPVLIVPDRALPIEEIVAAVAEPPPDDDDDDEREEPILEAVASCDSGLEAFAIKTFLQEHHIVAFLLAQAMAPSVTRTGVYVLERDLARARAALQLAH